MSTHSKAQTLINSHHGIVIYDGLCHFCNASVNFIIAKDPTEHFYFVPIQSVDAEKLLSRHQIAAQQLNPETILLVDETGVFERSDAIIQITRHLTLPWSWLRYGSLIPSSLRDRLYLSIATRRYNIAGKSAQCLIPNNKIKMRFIGLPDT